MDDLWITFKLADYFRRGSHKVAISLPELVSQTNQFSIKNRPGCVPSLQRSNPQSLYLGYNVKCHLKNSDPNGHDVAIQFDLSQVNKETLAKNLDCKVSCSCVAPETMIRMADGTEKRIDQVQVGDLVITHKGRARRVNAVMSRPSLPDEVAYELKATGYQNPLIIKDDHPIAVIRGVETCQCGCGKDLPNDVSRPSHRIQRFLRRFLPGHNTGAECVPITEPEAVWRQSGDVYPKELLYFPKFEWTGTEVVDQDLATLVGYYLAEGCILHREAPQTPHSTTPIVEVDGNRWALTGVKFTFNKTEAETLVTEVKQRASRLLGPDVTVAVRPKNGRSWTDVEVYSPTFALTMFNLAGVYSHRKKMSSEMWRWSPASMWLVLTSMALGDGHLEEFKHEFSTTSRDLATQISHFLFSQHIWNAFCSKPAREGHHHAMHRVSTNPMCIQKLLLMMLSRMNIRAFNTFSKIWERPTEKVKQARWGDGFSRSLKTRKAVIPPSYFMDLEVEEDASFIANGLTVHNCPAYLFYAGQWNSYQRDALEGEPRPLLTAPTERLDLREDFVICKHIKAVSERILPSVQHNIVKILRQRDIEQRKDQEKRTPERLEKGQEKLRDKQKNKGLEQDKQDVRKQLEKGLQQRQAPPAVVKRDTPATPDEKTRVKKIDPAEVPTPSTAQPPVTPPAPAQPKPAPAPPAPSAAPAPAVKAPAPPKPPKPAPKPPPKRKPRKVNSPLDADIDLDEEI